MSQAKICDKCGCVMKYTSDCIVAIYTHPYGNQSYELCDKCKKEFLEWIKQEKKR